MMPRPQRLSYAAAGLCVLLSLLLHLAGMALLGLLPMQERKYPAPKATRMVRVERVNPTEKKQSEKPAAAPQQEEEKPKPFAKTNPDTPERTPDEAQYESNRSTRAASEEDAVHRRSDADAPALNGREREEDEELVTFDSERQEGDLEHEGKNEPAPPTPPPAPAADSTETESDTAPAQGREDGTNEQEHGEDDRTAREKGVQSEQPPTEEEQDGPLHLQQQPEPDAADTETADAATQGTPDGTDVGKERPARVHRPVYDPSLADDSRLQPGFRTHERRTRSSGNFVFGKGAALNVAATPRGAYEAEIYRRVARLWYQACDDHRGDCIPGKITVSLRIDKRGRLVNMMLIQRRGAGMSQQAFTFKAIRQAVLPAMPPHVQAEVVGDLLELIFTFHFD